MLTNSLRKSAVFFLACFSFTQMYAQAPAVKPFRNTTPVWTLSTNLLYDATTSMNLGTEFKLADQWTLKLPVTYNPWKFSDNQKFKFVLVQPEVRYWLCEPFSGHFFGLHGHYSFFNVGAVGSDYMKQYRFQGNLYGGGLTYGYSFYLAPRWSLEASIGVGYARIEYDQYQCQTCGDFVQTDNENYIGPTQAGISLIYILK
ncbi:MAG: DUF3575 domain-containing protein [Dysgonamonadaceae bacterium]|nr:DUF3575 domain-containing protein [Dysgonamonadaceae bacterium]